MKPLHQSTLIGQDNEFNVAVDGELAKNAIPVAIDGLRAQVKLHGNVGDFLSLHDEGGYLQLSNRQHLKGGFHLGG